MEKSKNEQIDICLSYFKKSRINEKIYGTLVVVLIFSTSIFLFQFTYTTLLVYLFYIICYIKYMYDINKKWSKAIGDFKSQIEQSKSQKK